MNANEYQIGGSHYKRPGIIEHWDMIEEYNIGYLEGCATDGEIFHPQLSPSTLRVSWISMT